jgi:hypothetical protein
MIMFMMVSSVFTSKLIIAEDEGTDTDTDINLPIDDPQEAFLLKEHLNGESFVEVSGNRILLSDASEENNEFEFFGDEAEFVLLLSVNLDEEDENEYTYTLPEGVSINVDSLKTSDDLQASLEGNVLTVKKVKVDTPVDNNDDVPAEDSDTPLDNNDIDNNQVNDDLPLDDQLDNNNQNDNNDLDVVPATNNDKDTNENTDNNTNDDADLNKENDTQNGGASLDLPEYKTYVELSGTVLPETESFTVEAFGTFNKAVMMMLGAPLLRAPGGCTLDPTPIERVEISKHLIAKEDLNSAGVYAWIKLNGKQFTLNDHTHDDPQYIEEVDKLPEELPDNKKNVEVYLSWRVDPSKYEGTLTKDTVFVYTLPEGINWDPEEVDLVDLKDPDGKPAGTFKVNGTNIEVKYSDSFIKKVNSSCSSFTSYGTIEGSATMADWDDVGNEPYHFEGIGYFEPQVEEAVARIRTEKSIVKDTVQYLGNGRFLIQYRTDITGTHKIDGGLGRLKNLVVTDTFDENMSLPADDVAQYTLKSGSEDVSDRLNNSCGPGTGKTFSCTISYIDDKETLTLTYNLYLDINYTSEDPKPSPLSSATRTFENDVEVTADDPNDPTNKLKDTSFVIDTYAMHNPKKEGKPYLEAPEQAEWEIRYNVGKFSKASAAEFPGINLGGMFISDTMGPDQKYIEGTFVIETSQDGENWTTLSGVTPVWEDKDQDPEGIEEYFSFTLPENVYDFIRITYRSVSTNQNTYVDLTNTATIASDDKGNDEKSTDGTAPQVGPSNIPKIKKDGNEYGPDGNFEWKIEIDIYKEMNRNVRVYDAMEEGLILYPDTIKVERVKVVDGVEETKEITSWGFHGDTEGQNTNNRNPKPGDDLSNNPPWITAEIGDKVTWWIELTDEDTLLPANGYEFTTDSVSGEPVSTDKFAKYRITYQTNAPLPGTEEGKPVSKKYLNEAQVRVKSDDPTDPDDRYNTSKIELEKKYIEKESNDSVYKSVTGEEVDTTHGYIGWFVRVYPLDTNGYVEITDEFSYSTDKTSMKLVKDSVHVYVSTNKQKPTSADEIAKNLYKVTDNGTKGFKLRINSAPAAGVTKDKYVYVFYQTKVDPRINNTTIRYINTATLDRNGDKNYPPATASRPRTDIVISKTSKRNGPYVTYTMHINKQLLNIDTARQTLTIEDTRGASIEYVEGSMHFYDGSQYKASDSAEDKAKYELAGSPYGVTSNGHTISITIPDEKYVVIEYRAYITQQEGELEGEAAINRAVIKGQSGFSVSNSLRGKVQKARAGTSIDTDHPWIKIMKADSRNLRALQGAVFRFTAYDFDPETGELTPMDGEVYEIESDENGTIWFTFDADKEWMTYYDKVYEVKEIKAPKGYQLDSTPKYIMFPKEYGSDVKFTLNGKEIEVTIEDEQYLYRIDLPNKPNPGRKIPKTGIE